MSSRIRPPFVTPRASKSLGIVLHSTLRTRALHRACWLNMCGLPVRLRDIHTIREWDYRYGDEPVPVEVARADNEHAAITAENEGRLAPDWRNPEVVSTRLELDPQVIAGPAHAKFQLCAHWFGLGRRGRCRRSKRECPFAHGLDDLSDKSPAFQRICSRVQQSGAPCRRRLCQLRFVHTVEQWHYRHPDTDVPWALQQADPDGYRQLIGMETHLEAQALPVPMLTAASAVPPPPILERQWSRASTRGVQECKEVQALAQRTLAMNMRVIVDSYHGSVELERLPALYTRHFDVEWSDALADCGIAVHASTMQVVM